MPMKPPRRCSRCSQLVSGRCSCSREASRRRGTSTSRGYDADWHRLRKSHLQVEPLCRFCLERNRFIAAADVDHIDPFDGLADPRRLDPANLRSLCRSCHRKRHARSHGVSDHSKPRARNHRVGELLEALGDVVE
jgi:5-methylcytosine-specific restriction enzyme A